MPISPSSTTPERKLTVAKRKIVLLVVEGASDASLLVPSFSALIENRLFQGQEFHCDVLTAPTTARNSTGAMGSTLRTLPRRRYANSWNTTLGTVIARGTSSAASSKSAIWMGHLHQTFVRGKIRSQTEPDIQQLTSSPPAEPP